MDGRSGDGHIRKPTKGEWLAFIIALAIIAYTIYQTIFNPKTVW